MSTSLAEINVVPPVDVMLVLLIIFMVAAPMMHAGDAGEPPQAKRATPVTAQQVTSRCPPRSAKDRLVQINNDDVRVDILAERSAAK